MKPDDAYIILVEDDANNLMVTTDLLRLIGVKYVNSRASGRQALKLAESLPRIDLILLDIQLPHEDGFAVLKSIRTHPKLKDTRVVALTANVLPEDVRKAREAGFDGFIGKPVDFDRFPGQIQDLLAGEAVWRAGSHG